MVARNDERQGMLGNTNTLIRVRADFFKDKNQVAFKAQDATYKTKKAQDFKLTPTNADTTRNALRFFDDEKQVSISVSDKTLNFLQKHFYSGNFIALKDGSTALRGDAAVFVEGWYKDIMYNRGFLASNLNANASIEGATEHIGFKSSISTKSEPIKEGSWLVFGAGTNAAYQNGSANAGKISLDELMDKTLQSDKNRNGEITFLEAYAGEDKLAQGYENWLNAAMREHFKNENISINTYGIIAQRFANESAQAVGLYDDAIFESSLYGGLSALNASKLKKLGNELNPTQEQSPTNETTQIKKSPKDDKKDDEEELLALKYPEFRSLIKSKGAENISESELEALRQKKQIITSYQANTDKSSLKQEFTQAVFETNFSVWAEFFSEFSAKFSIWMEFIYEFSVKFGFRIKEFCFTSEICLCQNTNLQKESGMQVSYKTVSSLEFDVLTGSYKQVDKQVEDTSGGFADNAFYELLMGLNESDGSKGAYEMGDDSAFKMSEPLEAKSLSVSNDEQLSSRLSLADLNSNLYSLRFGQNESLKAMEAGKNNAEQIKNNLFSDLLAAL